MTMRWQIAIEKDDIRQARLETNIPEPTLEEGEIEVALRHYALTANNVTYATMGKSFGSWTDMPGYWAFFPHNDDSLGKLPVWGFAEIVRSKHPELEVGEELYGYFPLSSHVILKPGRVSGSSLVDEMPHRQKLAPVYNQYNRVRGMGPDIQGERDLWPVFRPLFVTGYMICDQFAEAGFYGSEQILIGSASSKTALMTARCFQKFENVPRLVGLTSPGNRAYVEASNLYDQVVVYSDVEALDASLPTALIDMSGAGDVINRIHLHFQEQLKFSCLVGISHWDAGRPQRDLPGAPIAPFFAPGRIKQRTEDWGAGGLQARLADIWADVVAMAPNLTVIDRQEGPKPALEAYQSLVMGKVDPSKSLILTHS
ncbi:DUF2855 family protein [Sneathiella limimaris]|uniref:DUF2855 family protein n=1 Tax=Sneathiella limimaris TaxID=1964213 RepID=UPI00146D5019|nr:DUF2855 family protein [Sneathiella limimaris]